VNSALARDIWNSWLSDDETVAAPSLIMYEFVSAIRHRLRRGDFINPAVAERALTFLLDLDLLLVSSADLHTSAYRVALDLDIASAYDAHYVALAAELDCELWTADRHLHAAVVDRFPLVRLLGA
jgi:predicted nucleic acid-binding protein